MVRVHVLPPEKTASIAYNMGVYESVQKFGELITSGKITNGTGQVMPPHWMGNSQKCILWNSSVILKSCTHCAWSRIMANIFY